MPELPEVETIRRGLHELLPGRQITHEEHDTDKSFPNAAADVTAFLLQASVVAVRRRAKVLLIDLSTDYTLMIHLKMTGQLVFISGSPAKGVTRPVGKSAPDFRPITAAKSGTALLAATRDDSKDIHFGGGHPSGSLVGALPDKSTRVTLTFSDGSHLYFNDQRKFGWMKLLPTLEIPNINFMKRVGPEPLEADFTAKAFAARFTRRPRTSIKAALLDQSVVAGIGNIYADESLWGAKIHPSRLVASLTSAELKRLYVEVRAVMNLAIEKGGSTNRTYVNAAGERGRYMDFARVFRREGLACPRCGTEIIKLRVAGRGTHICPHCQQL